MRLVLALLVLAGCAVVRVLLAGARLGTWLVLRAYDAAGDRLRGFAAESTSPTVAVNSEPEPTVPEYLQNRLAADQELRARNTELMARLQTEQRRLAQGWADLERDKAERSARLAAQESAELRDARIATALHTLAAWRVYTGGLAFVPRVTQLTRCE